LGESAEDALHQRFGLAEAIRERGNSGIDGRH
jgi:hypothetical protein